MASLEPHQTMLPVFESIRFPALTDPDVESDWEHTFEVRKSALVGNIQHFSAVLDRNIPILFEYDIQSRVLKIAEAPWDVDLVHPTMYDRWRPMFEYASGPNPEEALSNPNGADIHFLPTFGRTGPIVPYVLSKILATEVSNILLPDL